MATQSKDFNWSEFNQAIKDIERNTAYALQTKTGEVLEIVQTYEQALEAQKEIENNPELEEVDILPIEM